MREFFLESGLRLSGAEDIEVRNFRKSWANGLRKLVNLFQYLLFARLLGEQPEVKLEEHLRILTENELIRVVISGKSFIRWGDGETEYLLGKNIHFQRQEPELRKELKSLLANTTTRSPWVLGIPLGAVQKNRRDTLNITEKAFWFRTNRLLAGSLVSLKKESLKVSDALIFRTRDPSAVRAEVTIGLEQLANILIFCQIIFVGPIKTGTSISKHHPDVKIIEIPSHDAYRELDRIEATVRAMDSMLRRPAKDSVTVCVSAGPAGKALVARLAMSGIRAIDLGASELT